MAAWGNSSPFATAQEKKRADRIAGFGHGDTHSGFRLHKDLLFLFQPLDKAIRKASKVVENSALNPEC
jgi:hypothetical protein